MGEPSPKKVKKSSLDDSQGSLVDCDLEHELADMIDAAVSELKGNVKQ